MKPRALMARGDGEEVIYLMPCIHFLMIGESARRSTPEPNAKNPTLLKTPNARSRVCIGVASLSATVSLAIHFPAW